MILNSELNLSSLLVHAALQFLIVRRDAVPLKHEELKLVISVLRFEEHRPQVVKVKGLRDTAADPIYNVEVVLQLAIRKNVVPELG